MRTIRKDFRYKAGSASGTRWWWSGLSVSKWHQSSDRREQNDPAVHKVGSDPGSDPEMQNPFHSTWHGTCLPVRFPNLRTPNLVPQFGDQAPWHLLVRLFKLETQTHFKSRISGSTCTLCNFSLAIENVLQTIM